MNLEEGRQRIAELGRQSLWILCKAICFPEPPNRKFQYNNALHKELADIVQDPSYSKKLVMIPRGHLKTTIATKGRAIHWVINNSDERILLVNATSTNAERFLFHIEKIFESNPLFRWLYPELMPDFNKVSWSKTQAQVNRTGFYSEPTFDTAGVGTGLPSRHYTKIIKDDIVNDKNSNTQELLDQVIEWDASTIPLFDSPEDPSNEELVIGTPWSNLDVYAAKREDSDYAVYVRHALENSKGEPDFKDGLPIYPERYSKSRIYKIRERLENDELFFCQYMCDPHGGSGAEFKREYLQYFDSPPRPLEVSITIDPGGLKGGDSDFTGIVTLGVDLSNNWYVLHIVKERLNPREIIEQMFQLNELYKPHTIGIETVAWQKSLKFFALEEMRAKGVFLPLIELKTDTRISKEMRIRGLIPRFSNKTVFLRKSMKVLEDEMFRRVRNDDLMDALAYQLQVATRRPQAFAQTYVDPFSMEYILWELAKKNKPVCSMLQNSLTEMYADTAPWGQLRGNV